MNFFTMKAQSALCVHLSEVKSFGGKVQATRLL